MTQDPSNDDGLAHLLSIATRDLRGVRPGAGAAAVAGAVHLRRRRSAMVAAGSILAVAAIGTPLGLAAQAGSSHATVIAPAVASTSPSADSSPPESAGTQSPTLPSEGVTPAVAGTPLCGPDDLTLEVTTSTPSVTLSAVRRANALGDSNSGPGMFAIQVGAQLVAHNTKPCRLYLEDVGDPSSDPSSDPTDIGLATNCYAAHTRVNADGPPPPAFVPSPECDVRTQPDPRTDYGQLFAKGGLPGGEAFAAQTPGDKLRLAGEFTKDSPEPVFASETVGGFRDPGDPRVDTVGLHRTTVTYGPFTGSVSYTFTAG